MLRREENGGSSFVDASFQNENVFSLVLISPLFFFLAQLSTLFFPSSLFSEDPTGFRKDPFRRNGRGHTTKVLASKSGDEARVAYFMSGPPFQRVIGFHGLCFYVLFDVVQIILLAIILTLFQVLVLFCHRNNQFCKERSFWLPKVIVPFSQIEFGSERVGHCSALVETKGRFSTSHREAHVVGRRRRSNRSFLWLRGRHGFEFLNRKRSCQRAFP
jgi:hypothetical protein